MKNNRADLRTWRCWLALVVAVCGISCGGEAQGNSYAIIPWTQGWTAAKADAEARGGHLATITSEEEWNKIWNLFGDDVGGCLLGGTDAGHEGVWSWVTGETWQYTRWETGEPNNGHNEQHYVWIWAGHDGKWDDVAESAGSKYLFESEYNNANITLTTTGRTFDKAGGVASVLTAGSGNWTAWTETPWIALSRASGTAGESCIYMVDANSSADTRTGWIYIEDQTFTVTQTGYTATISPMAGTATFEGGSGTIEVTVDAGVSWEAKANNSWLSVSPSSGTNVGAVTYTVAAYTNGSLPRSGTITIAGQTFTVTQTGTDVTLSPTTKTLSSSVGTFEVKVIAEEATEWSAMSNASWISVVDGGTGHGSSTVILAVVANPSVLSRTGTVSVGSKTRTVTQAGTTNISFSITPKSAAVSPVGASGNVTVYSTPDAPWIAKSQSPWLTIADGASGAGNGTSKYIATANPTLESRTGQIAFMQLTIGGDAKSIPQAIPTNMTGRHFILGNSASSCEVGVSSNKKWSAGSQFSVTMAGWSKVADGHGQRQQAIGSAGTGTIVIDDMNLIFPATSCVTNKGLTLSTNRYCCQDSESVKYWDSVRETFHWEVAYYPYPIECSGPFSATYNYWIYLNNLPKTNTTIIARKCVSGYGRDARMNEVNEWYWDNRSDFLVSIDNSGRLFVKENGTNTFMGCTVPTLRWTMLTLVGDAKSKIDIYLNGQKTGSVKTALSFAFFPPTDARYCGFNPQSTNYPYTTEIVGSICPTVMKMTIGGWDGAIDEMTFIDGALSSNQVQALYKEMKPEELIHTVSQRVIEPTVTPTSASFEANGGSGSISVTVAASSQWTVESSANWISFPDGMSYVGAKAVSYTVAPNPGTATRTATLTLAGKKVTVRQAGQTAQLSYDGTVFGVESGGGVIRVQVGGDATWTASSDSSWLTLMTTNGQGNKEIMFVVDDFGSPLASRTATVTIAGQSVKITQRGYPLSIDPTEGEVGSNAGTGEIAITAPDGAVWEAFVSADWIALDSGNMGVGSDTLRYSVEPNTTGGMRTGKIIISGEEYTLTQHPHLKLTTIVEGGGTITGGGDYETNAQVTLRAVPDEWYEFTHWSGDASGVESEVIVTMDMDKTVSAHFIPAEAAQHLVEEKAAQGGFYTREQMRALAMGDAVIEVENGTVDLAIQLQECADLAGGDWGGVDAGEGEVGVDGEGKVHIRVTPKGNVAFYRLMGGGGE